MGKVLIIKDADFSANKVETIPLVDTLKLTQDDYLFKDLKLQLPSSGTTFAQGTKYFGGFVEAETYRGLSCSIINKSTTEYLYYAFIKDATLQAGESFDYCTATSLSFTGPDTRVATVIPDDCDYIYLLVMSNNVPVDSDVVINQPLNV